MHIMVLVGYVLQNGDINKRRRITLRWMLVKQLVKIGGGWNGYDFAFIGKLWK
jgi:hypothetical protein